MAKNSPAKLKANNKYTKSHYDRFTVNTKKGNLELIENYAKSQGMTKNQLIIQLLKSTIGNEFKE